MRHPLLFLAALMLTGCGRDSDEPVYDTANNPDHYPDRAVALLDSITEDHLTTFEEISDRFAQLYTDHPNLLGNEPWRLLIERLGSEFYRKGTSALDAGLDGCNRAAGYFALAALARPADPAIQDQHALFACWTEAAAGGGTAILIDSLSTEPSIS